MNSFVFVLLILGSIEATADGSQLRLAFDGPVAFTQRAASSPARLILEVLGASLSDEALAAARSAGLLVEVDGGANGGRPLRLIMPVPQGFEASAAASGSDLTIRIERAASSALVLRAAGPGVRDGAVSGPLPRASGSEDIIGPEDLLEVNVFELPELKTTTRVLGDGTVSLPLLGVVQAAGLTRTGLEARLSELLSSRFVQDPQVSVSVTEHRSRLVSVIGAVTKPGTYPMIGPRTLLQIISEAGGLTREAGADIVILRKRDTGESERLHVELDQLVVAGDPALNLSLVPGDVVNIPIDRPIYVFVDGAVKSPGQVEGKLSRPISLLQAVARTGGLTERANLRGVHVLRKRPDGSQLRLPVNLRDIRKGKADDIMLEDGDVVVVPETFF